MCTSRHHSRVRALEDAAYKVGVLDEIPREERGPQTAPRTGPRVPTAYAKHQKADRRLRSAERQKLAVGTAFQAAAACASLASWPKLLGAPMGFMRIFVRTGGEDTDDPAEHLLRLGGAAAAPFCAAARLEESAQHLKTMRDEICGNFTDLEGVFDVVRAMAPGRAEEMLKQLQRYHVPDGAALVSMEAPRGQGVQALAAKEAMVDRARIATARLLAALRTPEDADSADDKPDDRGDGGVGGGDSDVERLGRIARRRRGSP